LNKDERPGAEQIILLGLRPAARILCGVLAETATKTYLFDFSGWPQWAVVLVGTLVAVLLIWLLMKLLKVALWLLLFVVLIAGLIWAARLLIGS